MRNGLLEKCFYNANANVKIIIEICTEFAIFLWVNSKGEKPKKTWSRREYSGSREHGDQEGGMGSVNDMCQGAEVGASLVRDSRLPCMAIEWKEKKGWVWCCAVRNSLAQSSAFFFTFTLHRNSSQCYYFCKRVPTKLECAQIYISRN